MSDPERVTDTVEATQNYDHLDPAGWQAKATPDRSQIFYVHSKAKVVVWKKPATYIQPEWEEGLDPKGNSYWYNRLTKETMFEPPRDGLFTPALKKDKIKVLTEEERVAATSAAATVMLEARQRAESDASRDARSRNSLSSTALSSSLGGTSLVSTESKTSEASTNADWSSSSELRTPKRAHDDSAMAGKSGALAPDTVTKYVRSRSAPRLMKGVSRSLRKGDAHSSWRDWQEQEDPQTGRSYFYNTKTGDARWDAPAQYIDRSGNRSGKSSGRRTGTHTPSASATPSGSRANLRTPSRGRRNSRSPPNRQLKYATWTADADSKKKSPGKNLLSASKLSSPNLKNVKASSNVTAWRKDKSRGRSRDRSQKKVTSKVDGVEASASRRARTLDRRFDFEAAHTKWLDDKAAKVSKSSAVGKVRTRRRKVASAQSHSFPVSDIPGPPSEQPPSASSSEDEYEPVPGPPGAASAQRVVGTPRHTPSKSRSKSRSKRSRSRKARAKSMGRKKSSGSKSQAPRSKADDMSDETPAPSSSNQKAKQGDAIVPSLDLSSVRPTLESVRTPRHHSKAKDEERDETEEEEDGDGEHEEEDSELILDKPSPRAHSMSPRLRGQKIGGVRSGRKYGPWREAYDPYSSRRYFFHKHTGETTWEYEGPVAEAHKADVLRARAKKKTSKKQKGKGSASDTLSFDADSLKAIARAQCGNAFAGCWDLSSGTLFAGPLDASEEKGRQSVSPDYECVCAGAEIVPIVPEKAGNSSGHSHVTRHVIAHDANASKDMAQYRGFTIRFEEDSRVVISGTSHSLNKGTGNQDGELTGYEAASVRACITKALASLRPELTVHKSRRAFR